MTLIELRDLCERQIVAQVVSPVVVLVLPGRGRSATRRLLGRRGPAGRVVGTDQDHEQVMFDALQVRRWIDEHPELWYE